MDCRESSSKNSTAHLKSQTVRNSKYLNRDNCFCAVVSPPKSPTLALDLEVMRRSMSDCSSVEVVSEPSPPGGTTDEATARMTQLMQERIASLGRKPGMSKAHGTLCAMWQNCRIFKVTNG